MLSRATQTLPSPSASPKIGVRSLAENAINGHTAIAPISDPSRIISVITVLYEQRRDLLGTAVGLTNRLKALTKTRRGLERDAKVSEEMISETDYPPLQTLLAARGYINDHLKVIAKELEKLAVGLPAYQQLWEPTSGLGALGLALIVGEAGNLSNYSNHSKLWKRMGLHVLDGRALFTKRSGMTAEQWEKAGYCPRRRSVIYQIVDSLMKSQLRKNKETGIVKAIGAYGEVYLARKLHEIEKARAEGLAVVPANRIPKGRADEYRSEGHVHNRSSRYVGKKLLRDLWKVWRREATGTMSKAHDEIASRPPSSISDPAGWRP